jgi:hypothetical protein
MQIAIEVQSMFGTKEESEMWDALSDEALRNFEQRLETAHIKPNFYEHTNSQKIMEV